MVHYPEDFLKPRYRRQSITLTEKRVREGGGWLVVTSAGNTVKDWIETGRKFERMALTARERNIAIHPMTQYLEKNAGQSRIAEKYDVSVIPQFILRIGGLSEYPEPVSLRRPVSAFVKSGYSPG